jgi:hypothetical protein
MSCCCSPSISQTTGPVAQALILAGQAAGHQGSRGEVCPRLLTCRAANDRFAELQTPNRLYFHEMSAHTLGSKLSEPLGLVAGLPRQVFTLA